MSRHFRLLFKTISFTPPQRDVAVHRLAFSLKRGRNPVRLSRDGVFGVLLVQDSVAAVG
jgi:hypothetical protein